MARAQSQKRRCTRHDVVHSLPPDLRLGSSIPPSAPESTAPFLSVFHAPGAIWLRSVSPLGRSLQRMVSAHMPSGAAPVHGLARCPRVCPFWSAPCPVQNARSSPRAAQPLVRAILRMWR
ncbi:hypothetical protein AURDEDRAFT_174711 [Auricularia subglabra TFB-10046 SS5]|nr:hypothetical protein AURDEDRAFT_174711 [Auricularia subglabra TFB-10046 SS5]